MAPYAAASIGNTFGQNGSDPNQAAQLFSHAVLGATLAYINGGDPTGGALAGTGSEAAAHYLTERYNDGKTAIDPTTGKFDPNRLPEHVKEEIRATTGAIASVVGAMDDGGAAFNAQVAGVIGQNAVENPATSGLGNAIP
ncbi:MAG: hypothetical protein Q4G42_04465 [Neisseria sp.]|nr:hypothetical protein [Neisseria sp.]